MDIDSAIKEGMFTSHSNHYYMPVTLPYIVGLDYYFDWLLQNYTRTWRNLNLTSFADVWRSHPQNYLVPERSRVFLFCLVRSVIWIGIDKSTVQYSRINYFNWLDQLIHVTIFSSPTWTLSELNTTFIRLKKKHVSKFVTNLKTWL